MVEKISPLTTIAHPGFYGAEIGSLGTVLEERSCVSLVQLTLWPGKNAVGSKVMKSLCGLVLPKSPNSPQNIETTIMAIGPGRYLIESTDPEFEARLRAKIPAELGAVTGLSHARVVVRISGPGAARVLAKGIALDFHADSFPVGSAVPTHHHDIGLTIRRTGEEQFDLYVFTSFARGFWQWLTRAAAETGYEIR